MLYIELTNEPCFGEPGPSLVFIGDKHEIKVVYNFAKNILKKKSIKLESNTVNLKFAGFKSLNFSASEVENRFFWNKEKKRIDLVLSSERWLNVIDKVSSLLSNYGHQYIEFEDDECGIPFLENINVIVCSRLGKNSKILNSPRPGDKDPGF